MRRRTLVTGSSDGLFTLRCRFFGAGVWSRRSRRRSIARQRKTTREVPMYGLIARVHCTIGSLAERLRSQAGQGTVEYVALILLVALVMAGVVAAMKGFKTDDGQALGDAIIAKIREAVESVDF